MWLTPRQIVEYVKDIIATSDDNHHRISNLRIYER